MITTMGNKVLAIKRCLPSASCIRVQGCIDADNPTNLVLGKKLVILDYQASGGGGGARHARGAQEEDLLSTIADAHRSRRRFWHG